MDDLPDEAPLQPCDDLADNGTRQAHAQDRQLITKPRVHVPARRTLMLFVGLLLVPTAQVAAQSGQSTLPDELFRTIVVPWTQPSSTPTAKCDLQKFTSLVADDVGIHHDKAGLARQAESQRECKRQCLGKATRAAPVSEVPANAVAGKGLWRV